MKSKILKILLLIILVIVLLASLNILKKRNVKTMSANTYDYYIYWKKNYIVSVNSNEHRVVDPQNNNVTVSEGMGYGLIFSVTANDSKEFEKLWNYTRKYLDKNGLMNWKVDAGGNVIGMGSASDADQDIAYALLLASKKWPKTTYLNDARKMIEAIKKNEISSEYVLLPGDKWGNTTAFNPSYVSPSYYLDFGFTSPSEKVYWEKVSKVNLDLLSKKANSETGLLPDWVNNDRLVEDKNNKFGYDAVRVPLRLIEFYKRTSDIAAKSILEKENSFFSSVGNNKLVAGYSLSGKPLENYINTVYLSSYTAASLINEGSDFNKAITYKLKNAKDTSYYGCSLKMWVLFIVDGSLK